MKKALNGMKKLVKDNSPVEDFYKTGEFTCQPVSERRLGKQARMITLNKGYYLTNSGEQIVFEVKDDTLLNFFDKLNLDMFNVKGFFIEENVLAFNVTELALVKNKKPKELDYLEVDGRLPNNIVGAELQVDVARKIYFEYKESRELFKSYVPFTDIPRVETNLLLHDKVVVVGTCLNEQNKPCVVLSLS